MDWDRVLRPDRFVLRGRPERVVVRKNILRFRLEQYSIGVDMPGSGLRQPFAAGDDLEVFVRRTWLSPIRYKGLAFRKVSEGVIRPAGRGIASFWFGLGALSLGTAALIGELQLALVVPGFLCAAYGGYELWDIHRAVRDFDTTPGPNPAQQHSRAADTERADG